MARELVRDYNRIRPVLERIYTYGYYSREDFEQQGYQDLQKQQQEKMAHLIQKVRNASESVAQEGGYNIVQEKDMLLYFSAPVEDITPKVKAKLGI